MVTEPELVGLEQVKLDRDGARRNSRSGHVTLGFVFEILIICSVLGGIVTGLPAVLNPGNFGSNSTTDSDKLPILGLAVTSNGQKLWVQRSYSEVISIDLITNQFETVFSKESPRIGSWNISQDGRTLLVSNLEREVWIYRDGELIVSEDVPPSKSVATLLSSGGQTALRISGGTEVHCWNLTTTEPIESEFVLLEVGNKFAVDSLGRKLATSTSEYTERILRIYDVKTSEIDISIAGNDGLARDIVFSENDSQLAFVTKQTMTLYDVFSGKIIWTVEAPKDADFHCAAFSPDGKWVAVSGIDSGIFIIDRITGKCCTSVSTKSKTHKIGFSQLNDTLYTGDLDGTIWASCVSVGSEMKRVNLMDEARAVRN